MNVVIVESPAKAKTINKYLGHEYTVLASYGHVRDLPSRDGSVRPDDDFAMDWEVDAKAKRHLQAIARALQGARHLYLATDPDREGEAISWHVREVLAEENALRGVDVKRVVFNEVTKKAIEDAFRHPRELDRELVEAYLARRALDYLVGFTLSPVLWRKLPGSRSAGRVQSVALRLICERETEIENFKPREYWTVGVRFRSEGGEEVEAQLARLDGEKLDKFSLSDAARARQAVTEIEARAFTVARVERRRTRRNPPPPFITSTLQQEAARKLYFGARRTMTVAQRLYEGVNVGGETVGLITYMRTDGVQMADEAVAACRRLIGHTFGAAYVPGAPRVYKSRVKNAQEAHEAIRPTDVSRRPEDVARYLDEDQRKLYALVWQRTLASQMEAAVLDQVAFDIDSADGRVGLRATGSVVVFDGFLRLYREGRDDAEAEDEERRLPDLKEGQALERTGVEAAQHFTEPPPRYSEASLVHHLEELGIGRPSTYASIISVLQDRTYVRLEKRRFVPEDRGRLVTAFLASFFTRYVEYGFTADLEDKLDDVSNGRVAWKAVLREFWSAFSVAVAGTKDLGVRQVLDSLDALLGPHFFRDDGLGVDPRLCPACKEGRLGLKLGKFGAFIGCARYPDCRYTRPLEVGNGQGEGEAGATAKGGPKALGMDPETGLPVSLKYGPYGHYVQLGEGGRDKGEEKPKRTSLPKGWDAASLDLDRALALLKLPRTVGLHPETRESITAGIGRFGPYVRHQGKFVSLKGDDDVLTIGLNHAVDLLAQARGKSSGREIGEHPDDGRPVTVKKGRYGPYAQHGSVRATLPADMSEDAVTLAEVLPLLAKKAARKPAKAPAARASSAKKPAKKRVSGRAKKAVAGEG